jgi:Family of unknown function (DUF6166)
VKSYHGRRTEAGPNVVEVWETDGTIRALDPRFDLRNHSPDGFEWGYGGSGPSQLALAILVDLLGEIGQVYYHDFKWARISTIETRTWSLTEHEIRTWYESTRP